MAHLEEYQTAEIQELFNCSLIRRLISEYDSTTEQQEAVLRFIAENPTSQYIKLQNTFRMSDTTVVNIVLNYGAKPEEMNELRELREKKREA